MGAILGNLCGQLNIGGNSTKQIRKDIEEIKNNHLHDIKKDIKGNRGEIEKLRIEVKGDIATLKTELKGDIATLKTELKGDIATLKTDLKEDISDVKKDIKDLKKDIREDYTNIANNFTQLRELIINK